MIMSNVLFVNIIIYFIKMNNYTFVISVYSIYIF